MGTKSTKTCTMAADSAKFNTLRRAQKKEIHANRPSLTGGHHAETSDRASDGTAATRTHSHAHGTHLQRGRLPRSRRGLPPGGACSATGRPAARAAEILRDSGVGGGGGEEEEEPDNGAYEVD